MELDILNRMIALAAEDVAAERTVCYIADHLRSVLKRGERAVICFSAEKKGGLGWLMQQAVLRCGGVPVVWGPDYRWKTVLQQSFFSHASVIIGPPLIVLGLCKLKKYTGLPLYIRHAVLAGYPCLDWMIEGIENGLDCTTSGCFGFGETGIIAGYSCHKSLGVHLRPDTYGISLRDKNGDPVSEGENGRIYIYLKEDPELCIPLGDRARITAEPCPCGRESLRLMDFFPGEDVDRDLADLGQKLHSWTSVLDCRMRRSEYGLELEIVVFPGEKLPRLPSSAKLVVRPWDPKHDTPFFYAPTVKNHDLMWENH